MGSYMMIFPIAQALAPYFCRLLCGHRACLSHTLYRQSQYIMFSVLTQLAEQAVFICRNQGSPDCPYGWSSGLSSAAVLFSIRYRSIVITWSHACMTAESSRKSARAQALHHDFSHLMNQLVHRSVWSNMILTAAWPKPLSVVPHRWAYIPYCG